MGLKEQYNIKELRDEGHKVDLLMELTFLGFDLLDRGHSSSTKGESI